MRVHVITGAALAVGLLSGVALAAGPRQDLGFVPESYFAGHTRSSGTTADVFGEPTGRISGETRGRRERDGSTSLEQTIRLPDGSVRRRSWRIVRTGPESIEATGSDVVGKASGQIQGRTLHLMSTIRWSPGTPLGELEFDQTLELQPDGRTVRNRSTVSKFGVVVQRIDETFVRQ